MTNIFERFRVCISNVVHFASWLNWGVAEPSRRRGSAMLIGLTAQLMVSTDTMAQTTTFPIQSKLCATRFQSNAPEDMKIFPTPAYANEPIFLEWARGAPSLGYTIDSVEVTVGVDVISITPSLTILGGLIDGVANPTQCANISLGLLRQGEYIVQIVWRERSTPNQPYLTSTLRTQPQPLRVGAARSTLDVPTLSGLGFGALLISVFILAWRARDRLFVVLLGTVIAGGGFLNRVLRNQQATRM